MARRKLSDRQRGSLRRDLEAMLAQGAAKADILKSIARKYHITPISVRWYLKTLTNGRGKRFVGGGGDLRAVDSVRKNTREALRRAETVKKLLPKWEAAVKEELSIEKRTKELGRALEAARTKARRLREKIGRFQVS